MAIILYIKVNIDDEINGCLAGDVRKTSSPKCACIYPPADMLKMHIGHDRGSMIAPFPAKRKVYILVR